MGVAVARSVMARTAKLCSEPLTNKRKKMISLYNITLTSDTNGGLDKVKENIKIDDVAQL